MNQNQDLFDTPAPYVPSSATSRAAAAAISSIPAVGLSRASELRLRVLNALRKAGPLGGTDEELQVLLGMDGSTERPRRVELVTAGLVHDTGKRRPTRSGRLATVWGATDAA